MRYVRKNKEFGDLFRKYRLKSAIKTLAQFADLLGEENIYYDLSIYARWQSGSRVPKDRKTLLAILNVFAKNGGIASLEEANLFMNEAQAGSLTLEETNNLHNKLKTKSNKSLPPPPPLFVRDEEFVKNRIWQLMNHKHITFNGMPGVGKTYLSVYLANKLKKFFSDGVFWFNSDELSFNHIADTLLEGLGQHGFLYKKKDLKLEKLYDAVKGKSILIVIDGAEKENIELILEILNISTALIVTTVEKIKIDGFYEFEIKHFSNKEYEDLCIKVLGDAFLKIYKDKLHFLAQEIEYLPLSTDILLNHIHKKPISVVDYQTLLLSHKNDLKMLSYDNKNLYIAIHLLYSNLTQDQQNVLLSLAIFKKWSISVTDINEFLSLKKNNLNRVLKELHGFCLIQKTDQSKYHMHQVLRNYLSSYLSSSNFLKLYELYIKKINKIKHKRILKAKFLESEKNTISYLIENLLRFGEVDVAISLFDRINALTDEIFNCSFLYTLMPFFYPTTKNHKNLQNFSGFYIFKLAPFLILKEEKKMATELLSSIKKINKNLNTEEVVAISILRSFIYFKSSRFFGAKTFLKLSLNQKKYEVAEALNLLIQLNTDKKNEQRKFKLELFKQKSGFMPEYFYFFLGCLYIEVADFENSILAFKKSATFSVKEKNILMLIYSYKKIKYIGKLNNKDYIIFRNNKKDFEKLLEI